MSARALLLSALLLLAPAGPAAAQPGVPPIDTSSAGRCDFLDPSVCLQPFPNDWFTRPDRSSDTGRRVNLARESMPANAQGVHIDPTEWNRADGFSPGSSIVVHVPGLDFERSGIVSSRDMAQAFDRRQPVVVIDAATRERQLVWAELDAKAASDEDRQLIIRPGRNFREGHRYIVSLSNLRGADGRRLEAPAGFRVYRDRIHTRDPVIEGRRGHMRSLLRTLRRAKIERRRLYLAWDFTVASERGLSERALHIRDDAFAQIGDTDLDDHRPSGHSPAYSVTTVRDFTPSENASLARQVEGTFTVPCYLSSPGCAPGGRYQLDADGLPQQTPGNVMSARFVCNIPRSAWNGSAVTPARPSLYGHGLFGSIGEARGSRNVHQLGDENNVLVCATDWSGMAEEDVSTVAIPSLLELSGFPALADRLQQGFLNFMFLGRLLNRPDGLAADPAFVFGGGSVIDTDDVFYYGNSQGGILGGALTALSPDVTRSVLYVPGMNYSTLLDRSVDFDEPDTTLDFAGILELGYPSDRDRPLIYALIQMVWDRGEPNGYAQHMTRDPLPNTPAHRVLIEMAFGDHQVANVTTEVMARTIGARLRRPALDPGRSLDAIPQFGIPPLGRLPRDANGMVVWDIGPNRIQDGVPKGTNPPPPGNTPPSGNQDPHDYVIETSPAVRRQIAEFLRRDGEIVEVCGNAPCRTPDWAGP